jgi:hypothetical protein
MKAEEVEELNSKMAHLRKLLADNIDGAAIRSATSDVQSYSLKAFETSYRAKEKEAGKSEYFLSLSLSNFSSLGAQQQQQQQGQPSQEGETIDADFKDVNDKKK